MSIMNKVSASVNPFQNVMSLRSALADAEAALDAAKIATDEAHVIYEAKYIQGEPLKAAKARVNRATADEADATKAVDAAKKLLAQAEAEYSAYVKAIKAKEAEEEAALDAAIAAEKAKPKAKKIKVDPAKARKEQRDLDPENYIKRLEKEAEKAANKEANAARAEARKARGPKPNATKEEEPLTQAPAYIFKAAKSDVEKKAAEKTLRDKQTILQPVDPKKPKAKKVATEKPDGTRRERIEDVRAKRAEECAAKIKADLFAITKDTALEVAKFLVRLGFDRVQKLEEEELTSIKGIGPKYAAAILEKRWSYAGWVLVDKYQAEPVPKPTYRKERQVSFNQKWDGKDKKMVFVVKDVMRPEGALDEYVKSKGYDPYDVFITLVGYIEDAKGQKDANRVAEQKRLWEYFCNSGFTARGGKKFKILFNGTNGGNKCEVIAVREDAEEMVLDFCTAGASLNCVDSVVRGKITEEKLAAYMGLQRPGTVPVEKYVGLDVLPEEIAVIPEYIKEFFNQHVDFVDVATGEVKLDVVRDVKQNMFDGMAFMHFSDKKLKEKLEGLTEEQKKAALKKLAESKPFSSRMAWWKALIDPTVDFHAVLRKLGVTHVMTLSGEWKSIDDIVVFGDQGCFKAKIDANGQFATYQDYCDNCRRLGHKLRVLIREHHDQMKALPFQQLQSMVSENNADMAALILRELETMLSYQRPESAVKLLGGELAKMVSAYPTMLKHPFVALRVGQVYERIRAEAMGGKLHNVAHYAFLGVDPVAFAQHIAYVASNMSDMLKQQYASEEEYVTGAIAANEVVCAINDANNEAVMSRNPSTDAQAQCVVKVNKDFGEWAWAIRKSNTVYTSVMDYNVTRIRGDFDGDHVFISFREEIIRLAKAAIQMTGGRLIDWVAPAGEKHLVTRKSMSERFARMTQKSQLGHWADMLTSLVGYGPLGYSHAVACWLVMAVNVFVDAGKHGMGDVVVPEFVLDFLTVKDKETGEPLFVNGRRVMRPMPVYAMQAKDARHPNAEYKKLGSARCAKSTGKGNGDRLFRSIGDLTPSKLVVDTSKMGDFNADALKYTPGWGYRGCAALFASGTYNTETKKYEDEGLWKQLCYERSHELRELRAAYGENEDDEIAYKAAQKDYNAFKRFAGIKRLQDWADENGVSMEDVCDVITHYTWHDLKMPVMRKDETAADYENRVGRYKIFMQGWIEILGGMALRAMYGRDFDEAALEEASRVAMEADMAAYEEVTEELF